MTGLSPLARLAILGVAGTLLLALGAMAGTGFSILTGAQAGQIGPSSGPIDGQARTAVRLELGPFYQLDIPGVINAFFTEIEGLDTFSDVQIEQSAGQQGEMVISKSPGDLHWGEITLRRGLTDNFDLWHWRQAVILGDPAAPRDGSIVAFDLSSQEAVRFNFTNGWPSGYAITLAMDPTEEITIAHDGFERAK